MSMSLRARLTLWFGLVVAVSLGVFGVLTYTSVSSELKTNLDVSLSKVVSSLDLIIRTEAETPEETPEAAQRKRERSGDTSALADELAFLRKDSLGHDTVVSRSRSATPGKTPRRSPEQESVDPVWSAIYEHIVLNPRNFMIQIMDTTGRIVYRSDNLGKDSLGLPDVFLELAQDSVPHFTTVSQIVRKSEEPQSIRVAIARSRSAVIAAAYPVDEVRSLLEEFFGTLVLLGPVVLVLSTFGGWFLARASLHPVDEITRTAKDITASNLSRRLQVPNRNDEIGRLSETLNDMISRLESSFERIRQFTADASHELRTPLTILTGELELALRTKKTPEQYQDILSSALQEVLRLSRVVEYLLLLSRADMGHISIQTEPTDLTEMLSDLADAATILGTPKNIYITYRNSEDLEVHADRAKLYQVFLNLVDNAVKYTPEGGLISITQHRDGKFAEVRVRDTGIGISSEHQKKIFDRFYRVDKARSRELGGAGLGLSIVQWTVGAHGGTISVESEPGQGSTFIVRLPLIVAEEPLPPTAHAAKKHRGVQHALEALELTKFLKKPKSEDEERKKS